jgi:hypothetical protein
VRKPGAKHLALAVMRLLVEIGAARRASLWAFAGAVRGGCRGVPSEHPVF